MKIKMRKATNIGLTFELKFGGKIIHLPFPVDNGELKNVIEIQEQEIETSDAGYIKEYSFPAECKIGKWKKIGELIK